MLLTPLVVKAQTVTNCYSNADIENLATFKKNCDGCKMDLVDTKEALNECVVESGSGTGSAGHMFGGVIGGLVLGVLVCSLTHVCN